jgi:hypothetical protein
MTDRELMQFLFEVLDNHIEDPRAENLIEKSCKLLRDRLAQPEPDAVLVEREACAKVVEADGLARGKGGGGLVLLMAAERIRARGEK